MAIWYSYKLFVSERFGNEQEPAISFGRRRGRKAKATRGRKSMATIETTSIETADGGRLSRLAHFTARHRWAVIGVWVVLTLLRGVAAGKLSSRWYQSFSIPGKRAYEASQRALKAFGVGVRPPNVVVFHTAGDATRSMAIERAMRRAAATMPGALTSSYF